MINIKDKYLIISNNDFSENQFLLDILSDFEYKNDSEIYIVLDELYEINFINKLVNILGYISSFNHVNHFINIFTCDNNLINIFNKRKDILHINGIEINPLLDIINKKIIELDTRLIVNKDYINIIIINKDNYNVYNPILFFPEIKIRLNRRRFYV